MIALLSVAAGVPASGCWPFDFTEKETGAGSTSGGEGGSVPPKPECIPSVDNPTIDESCGVFVSSETTGDPTAELGSKANPFKNIASAVAVAADTSKRKPRVYACKEPFREPVILPGGVDLFGGLLCREGWTYGADSDRTLIQPGSGEIPLKIASDGGKTVVQNVDAEAAEDTTPASGSSSIAVIVDRAEVALTRCTLTAKNASEGATGESRTGSGAVGVPGNDGNDACTAGTVLGGAEPTNSCPNGPSTGGLGGIGTATSGASGNAGLPGDFMNGGNGEVGTLCADGKNGTPGNVGNPGGGATGQGQISASGYSGPSGSQGVTGDPGQGGGGGGGSKGGLGLGRCSATAAGNGGASGGSGGTGGCGGQGGGGGLAGGSSIALIAIEARLTLDGVVLVSGNGGQGGTGGRGQAGGKGGTGGARGGVPASATALHEGCAGGDGGDGGDGGPGGGGLGGHSIGIAYRGADPVVSGTPDVQLGEPGAGGPGADQTSTGAPGLARGKLGF